MTAKDTSEDLGRGLGAGTSGWDQPWTAVDSLGRVSAMASFALWTLLSW